LQSQPSLAATTTNKQTNKQTNKPKHDQVPYVPAGGRARLLQIEADLPHRCGFPQLLDLRRLGSQVSFALSFVILLILKIGRFTAAIAFLPALRDNARVGMVLCSMFLLFGVVVVLV
jgi:hypothetical protein